MHEHLLAAMGRICYVLLVAYFGTLVNFTSHPMATRFEVWHCQNTEIRTAVEASIKLYPTNTDLINHHLRAALQNLFDYYGGEWLITASRIDSTYNYVDNSIVGSPWFCAIYDKTYDMLVFVLRIQPAGR